MKIKRISQFKLLPILVFFSLIIFTPDTVSGQSKEAQSVFNRGRTASDAGDYDRAIADFTEALRLYPNYWEAYTSRGFAYYFIKDYDRAINDLTNAIRINPFYLTYAIRGSIYLDGKKDLDRAISDYTESIRINANFDQAYSGRGAAYYRRGVANNQLEDLDRAISDCETALKINRNNNVASSTLELARNEKAKRTSSSGHSSATDAFNRGVTALNASNYDRAIAEFTEAIRLNQNYTEAYYNLGLVYFSIGNWSRAITNFETTLRLSPNHEDAKMGLELARLALELGY